MNTTRKSADQKFCSECGNLINAKAVICPRCGCEQAAPKAQSVQVDGFFSGQRKKAPAAVLALIGGGIGIHKFYLGQPVMGLIYALACWTFFPAVIAIIEAMNFFTMSESLFQTRHAGIAWEKQ